MKILIRYSFILITTINSFSQVPTNGLIAHYPFNGNANDLIGGFNGTVNGATLTTDRFGNPNSAYIFNSNQQRIVLPNMGTKQKLSISGWFKSNGLLNGVPAMGIIGSTGVWNYGDIHIILEADSMSAAVAGQGKYCRTNVINGSSIGMWNHFVFTYGYTPDSSTFYINGRKVASSSPIKQTLDLTDYNIGYNHNANRYWNGTLDDFRLYDRILTVNEITSLYNENACFKTISVTDTLRISSLTGFNDIPFGFGTVKVYPNPSNSNIILDAENTTGNYNIKITNSLSQTVYTTIINKQKTIINLSSLGNSGVYYLLIQDNSNKVLETKKLILE